jgi:hypothetical protein
MCADAKKIAIGLLLILGSYMKKKWLNLFKELCRFLTRLKCKKLAFGKNVDYYHNLIKV